MKTKKLTDAPPRGFASQMPVTVAHALLFEWAAPSSSVAVRVLQQLIAGTLGEEVDFGRIRRRLAKVHNGLKKVASTPKKQYSQESVAQRLESPFFMPDKTAYQEIRTMAQQAKVDAAAHAKAEADAAARIKADAARPGECY